MQTKDFTHTHNGVTVTFSILAPLFQQACSCDQWPNMPVEDNQKSLEGLFTKSVQVVSDILISMFDTLRYVAIEGISLQQFLTKYNRQWVEELLPILNSADAPLSPVLTDATVRYQLYVLKDEAVTEQVQKGNATVFAGQTKDFTNTYSGVTVSMRIPASSFQQACASNQWPYMLAKDNQQLLQGLCTETVQLLSEILAEMLENPHYVAIENICLQTFLSNFSDRWLQEFLPDLQDSDAGIVLAPILTDAICWYMLYELKKDAHVEGQFQMQNPNAFAVLRFRAFGQPVLDHEPPIVLGNRPY